jgi:hypothetical protein
MMYEQGRGMEGRIARVRSPAMGEDGADRVRRGTMVSVILATMAAMMVAVFLVILTGGLFVYVIAFAAGMFGFGWLHYIMWGKLLTQMLREEMDEARREEQAQDERRPASTAIRQR